MAVLEKEDFWGGKLSKSSPEVKFNPEFEDSELSEVDHKLILSQACLGSKASGRNVVEVTAVDFQGNECTHTIVALREGSLEMCTLNLTFNPPATFKLIEGSGPVHLTGSHVQSLTEEEEESEEETDEESDEEVPDLVETKKQQKRPLPASTPKGPPNKIAKVVEEESDEEESDEEESDKEEEESDEEEGEEKSKKPPNKKDTKQGSKKPSNLLEKEAEEGEESEDESDEASDAEEEDEESDEEEDDDSDEEEESDEEEDEVTATLTAKKKKQGDKKPMTNGVGPKKAGKEAKTPQGKTPQGKAQKTPQNKTPQSKTPQPTKDVETIKQALVKSPALPKKLDKFQNFMRSSYKITDKDTVKDLWDYVQKNKK